MRHIREWKPTEKMIRYLYAMFDPEIKPTKVERCAKAGVDPTTIWTWEQNPKYNEWINRASRELLQNRTSELISMGLKLAPKDHRYWETLMKMTGNYTESVDMNLKQSGTVQPLIPLLVRSFLKTRPSC